MQRAWRETLQPILQHPAARFFIIVWCVAAGYVTVREGAPIQSLILFISLAFFSFITVRLTEAEAPVLAVPPERRRVALQLAVALLIIAMTGFTFLGGKLLAAESARIPLWSPLIDAVQELGMQLFNSSPLVSSPPNFTANPFMFFIVPGLLMLLLGLRPRAMGFRPGHRTWRVLAVWCSIPLIAFVGMVVSGSVTLERLLLRLISNTFQNGPFEEFLFRGLVHGRLRHLITPEWALVLQALIFGLWHLGANLGLTSDPLAAIAYCVISQGTLGLAFGVLYARTRNLVACSVFHVIFNTFGSLFG